MVVPGGAGRLVGELGEPFVQARGAQIGALQLGLHPVDDCRRLGHRRLSLGGEDPVTDSLHEEHATCHQDDEGERQGDRNHPQRQGRPPQAACGGEVWDTSRPKLPGHRSAFFPTGSVSGASHRDDEARVFRVQLDL